MNDIIKPVTKDGLAGWDEFGQFWIWQIKDNNHRVGSIYHDVREKICCVCRHGWEPNAESLRDQYFWDNRGEWAHQSCFIRYLALQEYDFWCSALVGAGFMYGPMDNPRMIAEGGPALESLPNGYWGSNDPWGAGQPWYRARLLKRVNVEKSENGPLGRTLKLGHRKRVHYLEIEPGEGSYDVALAQKLFASEDVTKKIREDGMMVHAWGRDKAREYLRHFAEILGVKTRTAEAAVMK